jgi:tRNA pseudouridine55 synthase
MQSGIILLNKKAGLTSFQALGEVKRALGTGKVGHTGTLDKFASGLLVVLVGNSLKLSPWFSHCDKQYRGTLRFGIETDTLDPEGSVIGEAPLPSREKVELALSQFTGAVMQEPPVYSAIHINGKRASSLARSGQPPEMKKRPVNIFKLELCSWEPPFAEIFVHCSSGTYIRSLARDIALTAESRAHLCSLVRTQVAGFTLEMAGSGEWGVGSGVCASGTLPYSSLLPTPYSPLPINKNIINLLGLPWFEIAPAEAENIFHGKALAPVLDGRGLFSQSQLSAETAPDFSAAVFSGETLIAVVEKADGAWKYGCVIGNR